MSARISEMATGTHRAAAPAFRLKSHEREQLKRLGLKPEVILSLEETVSRWLVGERSDEDSGRARKRELLQLKRIARGIRSFERVLKEAHEARLTPAIGTFLRESLHPMEPATDLFRLWCSGLSVMELEVKHRSRPNRGRKPSTHRELAREVAWTLLRGNVALKKSETGVLAGVFTAILEALELPQPVDVFPIVKKAVDEVMEGQRTLELSAQKLGLAPNAWRSLPRPR